jgi:MFS transporter, putative metabolite:H+ symporter
MAFAGQVRAGPRLDALTVGTFHYRIVTLVSLGLFLDGFDVYLAGGVLGSLVKSGWSSMDLNAQFVSATFIGMLIGALAAGIVGDRFGRRLSYQINLAIFGLASLAAAFAPSMGWLIVFRFVMGLGLGAELAIGYATIAEFIPARSRGRWVAISSLIANSSLFASALLGYLLIPNFGWRPMFAIVGVGAMILWIARKNMPESPRWLEQKGRFAEAEAVLKQAEAETLARGGSLAVAPAIATVVAPPHAPATILTLFRPKVAWRTMLAMMINISLGFANYGLVAWLPTFFVKQGISVVSSLQFTMVMSLGGPVGAFIGFLLADRMGRRPIMVLAPLTSAALALVYPHVTDPNLLMAVGFCLVSSIFVWLTIGYLVQTELFATEYRLRGTGFSSMVGRLATAGVQFAVVWAFQFGGVNTVVTMVAIVLATLACMFLFGGIETRQKPLETLDPELPTNTAADAYRPAAV